MPSSWTITIDRSPLASRLEGFNYRLCHGVRVVLNLEVPHSDDIPARLPKGVILSAVASDVPLDLLVPVALPAAGLPLAWMPVPERPIYEDPELPTRERNVDPATGTAPVTSPTSNALSPEGSTQKHLRPRVRSSYARHDAAATLGGRRRRAERV
jgi:hypothetical protein